jgi:hypothetical protein
MVSDRQVARLWRLVQTELTLEVAAAKAGMDPKTARKYLRDRRLPSEMKHHWAVGRLLFLFSHQPLIEVSGWMGRLN